jgi:uncharacterized protein (TIGR00251 family)
MFFQWQGEDLLLDIRVQPRASSDGFAEQLGERIKLRITAPPLDGKANKHLITLLAKTFKVTKNDISIISGETGRNKRIKIRRPAHLPEIISHRG